MMNFIHVHRHEAELVWDDIWQFLIIFTSYSPFGCQQVVFERQFPVVGYHAL